MKTIYILLISITLSLINKPIYAASSPNPFTTSTVGIGDPAKFVSLNGSIVKNKMILQWQIAGNESVDQFEVERSSDGKNFSMAALVFGTDKPQTDEYQFYEKANPKKVSYRVKLIGKDQKITYSSVIEISPETSTQKL